MPYLLIPLFAILNRARGSQFFNLTDSTSEARIVSTLFMGLLAASLRIGDQSAMLEITGWTWISLMFWCVFAWDKYWGAATGQNNSSNMAAVSFKPVDWIMSIIFPVSAAMTQNSLLQRLWGLVAMCLRQSLAAPWIVGLAYLGGHPETVWLAIFAPLLGVFYFIWGIIWQRYAVMMAELSVGAALGYLAILALS